MENNPNKKTRRFYITNAIRLQFLWIGILYPAACFATDFPRSGFDSVPFWGVIFLWPFSNVTCAMLLLIDAAMGAEKWTTKVTFWLVSVFVMIAVQIATIVYLFYTTPFMEGVH